MAGLVTSNNGIQLWTVPESGMYEIEAFGAEGGGNPELYINYYGGKGAVVKGKISLTKGQVVKVLVGQKGIESVTGSKQESGGGAGKHQARGGGGSYVSPNATAVSKTIGNTGHGKVIVKQVQ